MRIESDELEKKLLEALRQKIEPDLDWELSLFSATESALKQRQCSSQSRLNKSFFRRVEIQNLWHFSANLMRPAFATAAVFVVIAVFSAKSEDGEGGRIGALPPFSKENESHAQYEIQVESERLNYEREVQNAKRD